MEPGELMEAQDEYDASLDKAEERAIYIENTIREILPTPENLRGMACEVDAIKDLGDNDVLLWNDPIAACKHLKYRWERYRLELAERQADDAGY